MIRALLLSLGQLFDGRFLRVFGIASVLTILLSFLIAIGAGWGLAYGFNLIDAGGLPHWLQGAWGWLDRIAAFIGGASLLVGLMFLFPAVATAVMSLFLDDIVDAVEARHYPKARAPRSIGMVQGAWMGIASGVRLMLVNLLLAPLYLILLVTGVGPFVLYLLVNGYLLGRDTLQMVTVRHLESGAERSWRKTHRSEQFMLGVLVSLLFLLPVANLFAPLLGAAMATHLFHADRAHSA